MTRILLSSIIVVLAVTFATPADALVKYDFEQKFFTEFGYEVKDHALIRADGVYHLFYLRGIFGEAAIDIGHATSLDLVHWDRHDPILYNGPGEWDGHAIWAPQIIEHPNGSYVMYYTGVSRFGTQQTGVAFSNDLWTWSKLPWPVCHPDPSWALWKEGTWAHGRDPFVFEYEGRYYQLLTAKTKTNRGAISCAVSDDFFTWEDIGPLYTHTNWHVMESVQCFERNNKWYLFYTEEAVNGTSWRSSDSLFTGWEGSTSTVVDFGHAPEINVFDDDHHIYSRHSIHQYGDETFQHVIRIDTLRWSGDTPYVYRPWPLLGEWNLVWGNAFLYQPTFLNNVAVRQAGAEVNYEGMCWLSSYERYQGPLGIGSSGDYQGDSPRGVIRSKNFTITGNSMSLLVGGGYFPNECYVALVDAQNSDVLFSETGKNTDAMDRRYWDLRPHKGKNVYIEISDNSAEAFGHISCDDIAESFAVVATDTLAGDGGRSKQDLHSTDRQIVQANPELMQNTPNPFNPVTTISYVLPSNGYVVLDVFDVNGKLVNRLHDQMDVQGTHSVTWDATNSGGTKLSSGIYFYRLQVDGKMIATNKMILLK
jgi:predicted GH43/DUF377 family glycosyl hydrolase